jgi:tetratricopeptide (TPR) repeat protein
MAGMLDAHGMTDQALALLLRTDPQRLDHDERLYLADLLRRRERYAEALEEYSSLLEKDPSDGEAALRRAETLAWMGELDTALPLARELVRSQPHNRAARLLLARILSWSGRVDEAVAQYKRLLGEEQ